MPQAAFQSMESRSCGALEMKQAASRLEWMKLLFTLYIRSWVRPRHKTRCLILSAYMGLDIEL